MCMKSVESNADMVFNIVDGGLIGSKMHTYNSVWGTSPCVNYMNHVCTFLLTDEL